MADKFAIITGASSGIGLELARICAHEGYDLLIGADEPEIEAAAAGLRQAGAKVDAVQADLSGPEGVAKLVAAAGGRRVDALFANAGRTLGHAFLDQSVAAWRAVVDTNITGTLLLVHEVGRQMRSQGAGRILITGSIVGFMPGPGQAVYNGTKAFIDSFSFGLRHELRDSGVKVTCLMPGATETEVFERGDMADTPVGRAKKDDPAKVARAAFDAAMAGKAEIVPGWHNKLQAALAHVAPAEALAFLHRLIAEKPKE